ncbi:MAG: helix-turn-helix domain-containing protein, partial [Clostridia bacterium]|nr:helix-turn-helix domain-containing protein [Clostridia bacterium]
MNDEKRTDGLGERLYNLREEHRFSQDELAEKLGVSRQTISNWENDKVKIDVIKAAEICRLYGISMDGLFMEKETEARSADGKKSPRLKFCFLVIGAAFAAVLVIIAAVLLCLPAENAAASVVYLSRRAACISGIAVGAVTLIVLL